MRRLRLLVFACCVALLPGISITDARATETDQFTLPPAPLDDLGPDLGKLVLEIIHAKLAQLNGRREGTTAADLSAAQRSSEEREVAADLYDRIGLGMPEAEVERFLRYGDFGGRNVRFAPRYIDSIYAWVASPFPFAHVTTDCPTIRLYGVDLGTDKPGHIFQTGYEYLKVYELSRAGGADDASAVARAVQYGVLTELGIFGVLLTGVYSNGDLAGNYAGFKFFRNLFHEVRIGEVTLAPMVQRERNRWVVNPERDNDEILRPFITEHLNEAYNPSKYIFGVERIRGHIRDRCGSWFKRMPDFDEAGYRAHLDRTKTWFGEPYGWDLPEANAATLLECFGPAAQ